jgi:hypothetical protein
MEIKEMATKRMMVSELLSILQNIQKQWKDRVVVIDIKGMVGIPYEVLGGGDFGYAHKEVRIQCITEEEQAHLQYEEWKRKQK